MKEGAMLMCGHGGNMRYVEMLNPRTAKDLVNTEIEKPKEVIAGLLPVGAAIMAGEPKCGKSYVTMQMVIAIAGGTSFLGCSTSKCRVLYCDLESPDWQSQKRLEVLCDDDEVLSNIDLITQTDKEKIGTLGEGFEEQIEGYLDTHADCKLVVIDTLGQVMTASTIEEKGGGGQYAREKDAYDRLITLARNRQVAILVIDHTTKTVGKDPFKSIRGTYATAGSYDTLMVLSVPPQEGVDVGQKVRRLSVKGKAIAEQDIRIFLDESWTITEASTSLEYERKKKNKQYSASKIPSYIKKALDDDKIMEGSISEIREQLLQYGLSAEVTSTRLGKWMMTYEDCLKDEKILVKTKRTSTKRLKSISYINAE